METLYGILIIAVLASLVVSPVFAIIAVRRAGRMERRVAALDARLKTLEDVGVQPAPAAKPEDRDVEATAETEPRDSQDGVRDREAAQAPAPIPQTPLHSSSTRQAPVATKSIEELFASRWLVWLGGLTIALAGIFLVKYSIERQLLSPAVRVALGFLLGVCLICGGEWLRQRPLQRALASVQPDYVPPALTGAGVLICFGSVYASYAFLGLFAPLIAFVLLGAIGVGAMALALLQGPLIAVLGILGAFAVPLLVSTGSSSAWALFSYLLIVAASAFAVVRYKAWWWLAWMALAGAALWDAIWLVAMWRDGDLIPFSIHLLGMFALAMAACFSLFSDRDAALSWPISLTEMTGYERFVAGAALVLAVMVFAMVRIDGYSAGSLAIAALVAVVLTGIALHIHRLEALAAIAAALPVLLLVTWHVPEIVTLPEQFTLQGRVLGALPAPIVPPEFSIFAVVAVMTAAWFGIAGFIGVGRTTAAAYWATVSSVVPLFVLSVAFWRMADRGVELAWAAVAMGLASAATMAAVQIDKSREENSAAPAVGIYALAVIAAISLAATMTLENAWLTVALALQLPAAAWVHNRVGIASLRPVSFVIAGIVGLRLVFAHQIPGLDWELPRDPIWILYGYGIPAVALAVAARWFRRTGDDRLVLALESGAIAIAIVTVSLEIRHFVTESMGQFERYTLLEQSLHSISWLASGFALYRRCRKGARLSYEWGAKILVGLAVLQIGLLQVLYSNPVLTGEDIGAWPIIDVLSLAYLLPAMLAGLFILEAKRQGHATLAIGAGVASGLLLFCYLTLEVRHLFHGAQLNLGGISNAEGYTYSVVWLLYAAALFAVGFLWRVAVIRHAALALIVVIIAKVFLWDMSGLTGLYRVASFLGLGLSLVAIGYFYQRFMFDDRSAEKDAPRAC